MNKLIKKNKVVFISLLIFLLLIVVSLKRNGLPKKNTSLVKENSQTIIPSQLDDPLSILVMRQKDYLASDLVIEQKLVSGSNYEQYIASYKSAGLKIYGLLTIPNGEKPQSGWPVIIFNHGYISPKEYKTTERYLAYTDAFARNGYIVFKPDYRGNGNSEGQPEGTYYSPSYTEDVLNALSALKKYPMVDSNRIGMWGHSMGGNITLRCLVVKPDQIKAAVIWSGVVGTYDDLINNWHKRASYSPSPSELALRNRNRQSLIDKYGTPQSNPAFWHSLDPNYFLSDIIAPVQLHAGLADTEVPADFSEGLNNRLKEAGKTVELYTYEEGDHNLSSPAFDLAIQRSIDFFNKYLKLEEPQ